MEIKIESKEKENIFDIKVDMKGIIGSSDEELSMIINELELLKLKLLIEYHNRTKQGETLKFELK